LRTVLLWASLAVLFIVVFQYVKRVGSEEEIPFSQLLSDARMVEGLEDGLPPLSGVRSFTVFGPEGRKILGQFSDGSSFVTEGDLAIAGDLRQQLLQKGVRITYAADGESVAVPPDAKPVPFSDFVQKLKKLPADADSGVYARSRVEEIEVRGQQIVARYKGGTVKKTAGDLSAFEPELLNLGVKIRHEAEQEGFWVQFLISWVPMIFLFLIFFFFIRQLQVGGGKAMSFGKSRHRLLAENSKKVTFADVAGIDEAKEELREIVDFLKDPKKYTRLGGRIPKGVLLMGPPGTGKTLLGRGVAGEAGVPFFLISGSDFVEMFVGVGASRVRDLFEQGKKNAPCIIFIDEIDAVGRHRGAGLGGGHDEREQTLNQLLVEMDGFESNDGVILVAATNRPDVLDPALLRPGRFDRRVVIPLPDLPGRLGILKVHSRNKPLSAEVDLETVARGTPGFSGADLENLCNEAALIAARRGRDSVARDDFDEAKDKVLMGTERRSMAQTAEEKRTTAYHEAGHALVARLLPNADPLYKVTIIPRGLALGLTQLLPEKDRYKYTRKWLLDTMAMLMGGRVAEELVFAEQTTGAGQDIQHATGIAHKMVTEWGMSNLGPIAFEHKGEEVFLGRDFVRQKAYSEAVGEKIDREVKRLVNDAYERCVDMLKTHREALDALAGALVERETLSREDVEKLLLDLGLSLPPQAGGSAARSEPPAAGTGPQGGSGSTPDPT
jgi:cell division protease FtsH